MCRSRRELSQSSFRTDSYSNAYLLAQFGFDTAENDPSKVWPIAAAIRAAGMWLERFVGRTSVGLPKGMHPQMLLKRQQSFGHLGLDRDIRRIPSAAAKLDLVDDHTYQLSSLEKGDFRIKAQSTLPQFR